MQADREQQGRKQARIVDAHRIHPAMAELDVAQRVALGLLGRAHRVARDAAAHVLEADLRGHQGLASLGAPREHQLAQHLVLDERQKLLVDLVLVMMAVDIGDQHVVEVALVRLAARMGEQPAGVELLDRHPPAAVSDEVHGTFSPAAARDSVLASRPGPDPGSNRASPAYEAAYDAILASRPAPAQRSVRPDLVSSVVRLPRCLDNALQFHAIRHGFAGPPGSPAGLQGGREAQGMDQRGVGRVSPWRLAVLGALALLTGLAAAVAEPAVGRPEAITVVGNRRVEAETVRSYFQSAGPLDEKAIDAGLKALYASGLFTDAKIARSAAGITVTVVEAPVIDRVAFEGNKALKDKDLTGEVKSKAHGGLVPATVQADVARLTELYRHGGRYDVKIVPKTVAHGEDRVDLVFEITEGEKTTVKRIAFVGNRAFAAYQLRGVIKTGQSNLLSFLTGSDLYDPDRIEADRDLLRRFYVDRGYADVRIDTARAEFDPAAKGFAVTFAIDEGAPYQFGALDVQSQVAQIDGRSLAGALKVRSGGVYDATLVEKTVDEMAITLAKRGFPFATVRARNNRDPAAHTIGVVFAVEEGSHTYVERINIRGNGKTRDYVVRRE